MKKYLAINDRRATKKEILNIFGSNTTKLPPHDVNKNLGWTLFCVNNKFKKLVKTAIIQLIDEGNFTWFNGHAKTDIFLNSFKKNETYKSLREMYTPETLVEEIITKGWLSVKSMSTDADFIFSKDCPLYYEFFASEMGISFYVKIMWEANGKISVDFHD